jgi:hypothetical protein
MRTDVAAAGMMTGVTKDSCSRQMEFIGLSAMSECICNSNSNNNMFLMLVVFLVLKLHSHSHSHKK